MDIRATLLVEHSKANTLKIVNYVGSNQKRFDDLMELFLADEYRVTQRAAMAVGHAADRHPQLIKKHLKSLLENLRKPEIHDAIKRNTVRLFDKHFDLPEELMGMAAEICFNYLDDPQEAVAIRAFSMGVLYKICQLEPELGNELIMVLEDHLPHGSAGFKSRGKKILAKLRKQQQRLKN